jgi:hypothetical protein
MMATEVKQAQWILEADVGEDEYVYVCAQDIPTENEIGLIIRTVLAQYGKVPLRILSPEEIIGLQLMICQHWVVERRDKASRLPLANNKKGDVVN